MGATMSFRANVESATAAMRAIIGFGQIDRLARLLLSLIELGAELFKQEAERAR